jgi:choline kinase
MRGIIIGAGRGSRLGAHTDDRPKCFTELGGARILDWVLGALTGGGAGDLVFIGGYRIGDVRGAYPELHFRENADWPNNNILASLMYAEDVMDEGFVSSYSDIVYGPDAVRGVIEAEGDVVLAVDTAWRTRYLQRSEHPEDDAEKVRAEGDRVVLLDRSMPSERATGEFIGVARFSPRGARALREHYHRVAASVGAGPFRSAKTFPKLYLIDMIQELVDQGVDVRMAPLDGGYYEIDTTQDYAIARREWPEAAERLGARPYVSPSAGRSTGG